MQHAADSVRHGLIGHGRMMYKAFIFMFASLGIFAALAISFNFWSQTNDVASLHRFTFKWSVGLFAMSASLFCVCSHVDFSDELARAGLVWSLISFAIWALQMSYLSYTPVSEWLVHGHGQSLQDVSIGIDRLSGIIAYIRDDTFEGIV